MPGRNYTKILTIGTISFFQSDVSPNGVISATAGSLTIQSGGGSDNVMVWQNTDGGTIWIPIDITYAYMLEVLQTRGIDPVVALANLDPTVYPSVGSIPPGNIALDQWAIVNQPGPSPLVRQLAWSQAGEITWTATDWPYVAPPDPLGTWVINADDNTIGSGNNGWQYYMGTRVHITAAGNGLDIKRIAFKNGTGGNPHQWEIRKSTVVGASAPALATYTNIVASGTVTISGSNVWEEITLGSSIPVLQDEWYIVWYWVGTGGQFTALPLGPGQSDLTFADQLAGIFRFAAGAFPGPASGIPTNEFPTTLYGVATLGIG